MIFKNVSQLVSLSQIAQGACVYEVLLTQDHAGRPQNDLFFGICFLLSETLVSFKS